MTHFFKTGESEARYRSRMAPSVEEKGPLLIRASVPCAEVRQPIEYALLRPHRNDDVLPLLYVLHGGGSSRDYLERVAPVFERCWAERSLPPLVAVTPSAAESSGYLNSYDGSERWEDALTGSFLQHLRDTRGVSSERRLTLTCGPSMGGTGSLRLAFKHLTCSAAWQRSRPDFSRHSPSRTSTPKISSGKPSSRKRTSTEHRPTRISGAETIRPRLPPTLPSDCGTLPSQFISSAATKTPSGCSAALNSFIASCSTVTFRTNTDWSAAPITWARLFRGASATRSRSWPTSSRHRRRIRLSARFANAWRSSGARRNAGRALPEVFGLGARKKQKASRA